MQSTSPASLRLLGYPVLCGVLYVAWESEDEICGEYMLCVLYKSYLLLAVQQLNTDRYDVVALLSLNDSQVEKADDGRGQCLEHMHKSGRLRSSRVAMPYSPLFLEVYLRILSAAL